MLRLLGTQSIRVFLLTCIFPVCAVAQGMCIGQSNADVVVMMDRTGSMLAEDIINQKNAIRAFLDFFEVLEQRPRVALGSFNSQCGDCDNYDEEYLWGGIFIDHARIHVPLTSDYTRIREVLDNKFIIPEYKVSSGTNLWQALRTGARELDNNSTDDRERYLIVNTDFETNLPGWYEQNCSQDKCNCEPARVVAQDEAAAIRFRGIKIIGVHYKGDEDCLDEGKSFGRSEIVSAPPSKYYFEGTADLSGVYQEIGDRISCDDRDPCTRDSCIDGRCVSEQIDSDGDGTSDCDEDICTESDQSDILATLDLGVKIQDQHINSVIKKLLRLDKSKATRVRTNEIISQAFYEWTEGWTVSWRIPQVVTTCVQHKSCTDVDSSDKIAKYRGHSEALLGLADEVVGLYRKALVRKLRRKGKKRKAEKKASRQARRARRLHRKNMETLALVPPVTLDCG